MEAEANDGYKVGPGRPPREHQWKKGQSGNPGGRPKGESLQAILRRRLGEEHNGKTIAEIVVDAMIKAAAQGNSAHMKELWDRVEGKVAERMRIEGPRDPLLIKLVPPKATGEPEADARAQAAFEEECRRAGEEHPGSIRVVGDCWPE
jgi:hypothetical protein